jgi:hypothetical protein
MYYKLDADLGGAMNVYVKGTNNLDCDLTEGRLIDPREEELELPFQFTMKVRHPGGVRDEPRMYAYFPGTELMSRDLLDALRTAGVDNLQTFPALITEEGRPGGIENYEVVNVLGLVSCADAGRSVAVPLATASYFDKLVIDPARTRDLLLFRLAESMMDILVHERVAKQIIPRQFLGLQLIEVEERRG